jgi:hypothetical protein
VNNFSFHFLLFCRPMHQCAPFYFLLSLLSLLRLWGFLSSLTTIIYLFSVLFDFVFCLALFLCFQFCSSSAACCQFPSWLNDHRIKFVSFSQIDHSCFNARIKWRKCSKAHANT